MKVLITGGAGFIGSHIVDELIDHNYEIIAVDNLKTGKIENLSPQVKLYNMDINEREMQYVFELERPDIVVHLAAQTSVVESMVEPFFDFQTNTVATVKLLHLSKMNGVKKFIFASSAAVYGEPFILPVDENHKVTPQSFYAVSKYAAENYVRSYDELYGLESCILRFSNVYGPRQNSEGEGGVVSTFIARMLRDEDICIYGGSQTRDFVYVKDVAVACRQSLEPGRKGLFNISSNTEASIKELFTIISEKTLSSTKPKIKPLRPVEIVRSVLNNEKALSELMWDINYSISRGLDETISYYSNVLNYR